MTGGGSGGHITPILAVARELKRLRPDCRIVYISESGDGLDDVPAADPNIDTIEHVYAGKLRRYHSEGLRQLLDVKTLLLNLRDGFRLLYGFWQAFWLLRRLKPAIIFTRGSFVSVPVCLAAALHGVPYVTHDSDAIPSLTNRLIARWASLHAVALPEELYPYPIDKTQIVGVPISPDFEPVTPQLQHQYKAELGFGQYDHIVLVTGGGLGAQRINQAVVENATALLKRYPKLLLVHVTGRANEDSIAEAYERTVPADLRARLVLKGFITDMYRYSGAADVVIARGGATNLAELALQAKPCIIIPNPLLTGGHQLKNTAALQAKKAIVELSEDQISQELRLAHTVTQLLENPQTMTSLSRNIAAFARPDAAAHIAQELLKRAHDAD